jgi:hypothetical protein
MTQIKLVGMSMIIHCTRLLLSKCNGSRVFFIKQNVYFKFQPKAMFMFLVSRKSGLSLSCLSSGCLSSYKINGPTLTGAVFASTSAV